MASHLINAKRCSLLFFSFQAAGCLQEPLDLASMFLHSKPLSDAEDLLPTCYRCGSNNPLINPQVSLGMFTSNRISCVQMGQLVKGLLIASLPSIWSHRHQNLLSLYRASCCLFYVIVLLYVLRHLAAPSKAVPFATCIGVELAVYHEAMVCRKGTKSTLEWLCILM